MTPLFRLLHWVDGQVPGAVVYGGFLRDSLLGKPWTDVDIALPANLYDLEEMGFESIPLVDTDYKHDHIHATWRRDDLNVVEFAAYVSTFAMNSYCDIGLCRVAWSKDDGLIMSPEFIKDVTDQTLTVYRTEWGEDGVRKHLDRLKKKYPDFKEIWK